jgi:hypothetical protein
MKYALIQVLPDIPPGGVCAGIGWAAAGHVACVAGLAGRVKDRFPVRHDKAGITAMIARLRKGGAVGVAIERSDGALAEALLAAGLTVVVITSRQVKNLRSRHWRQGRPVRFLRAGRYPAHGPGAAAAAGPGRAPRRPRCARRCVPVRTWSPAGSRPAASCAPAWLWRFPPQ